MMTRSLTLLMAWLLPSFAQAVDVSIAAVVNADVITTKDVADRRSFIIASANLPDTPEAVQRLSPQVLRQLIDEALQRQEASRLGLSVAPAEMEAAVADIERQRNLSPGSLKSEMQSRGLSYTAFIEQLRAQLLFRKLVTRAVRPNVKISDADIDRARTVPTASQAEVQLAMLELPAETPAQAEESEALAVQLLTALQGGADFEATARQLAPNSRMSAPLWVPLSDLQPQLRTLVEPLQDGQISAPVRTETGVLLAKRLATRVADAGAPAQATLQVISLRASQNAALNEEAIKGAIMAVTNAPTACGTALPEISLPEGLMLDVVMLEQSIDNLAPELQPAARALSVGTLSAPLTIADTTKWVRVCERMEAPPKLADKDATYQRLFNEKMDLEIRKYLRNLRRNAFVDINNLTEQTNR